MEMERTGKMNTGNQHIKQMTEDRLGQITRDSHLKAEETYPEQNGDGVASQKQEEVETDGAAGFCPQQKAEEQQHQ